MSEPFSKFLLHYPITIVLLPLGEDEYKVGEFIMENINANSVSFKDSIPDENESDVLIINCRSSITFQELHHQNFLNRKYTKFPTKIIILLSVYNLLVMDYPLQYLSILSKYNIPILFSNIYNPNINFDIISVRDNSLTDSVIKLYENGEGCLIGTREDIIKTIRLIIDKGRSNSIIIKYADKDVEMITDFMENKNRVFIFYNSVLNSDGKVLDYNAGELVVL